MFQGKALPSATLLELFDALGEAVFSATEAGQLTAINAIGAGLLGFSSPDDALMDSAGRFFLAQLPEWSRLVHEVQHTPGPSRCRVKTQSRHGDPLLLELALTLNPDPGNRTLAGIFRDVSGSEEMAHDLVGRNAELEALRQLAVDAMRYDEKEPLLKSMLEVCSKAVGASGGAIYLYDVASKRLLLGATVGMRTDLIQSMKSLKLGQGFTGKVAVTRAPILVDDFSADPNMEFPALRALNVRNFASFPLMVKSRLLGIIDFFTMGSMLLTGRDFSLLSVLAAQVSLSLDHMIRMEELRDRNAELEKFNRLAVDRELRMVELKKRLRELETTASIDAAQKKIGIP
jgi:GAF domain-containing protein